MDTIQWFEDLGIGVKTFSIEDTCTTTSKYPRKLAFCPSVIFAHHRSGWNYQLSALRSLATTNPNTGILVDGFVDVTFTYYMSVCPDDDKHLVHTKPWIGFIHNPPTFPMHLSFYRDQSNQLFLSLLKNTNFIKSLPLCKGLITFSKHLADHILSVMPSEYQHIPIEYFHLPTEPCQGTLFSIELFERNNNKSIIQIGWWARKQLSIYYLKLREKSIISKKIRLLAFCTDDYVSRCMQDELNSLDEQEKQIFEQSKDSVEVLNHLNNEDYDSILSMNIAFADYWDCSASNLIIECIVRHTPILTRRHPALVEYLGEGYPFFFSTLDEASIMLCNWDLIKETHSYLQERSKTGMLSVETFLDNFVASNLYKSLSTPSF